MPEFNPNCHLINYTVLTETDEVFQKDWGVPAPVLDEEGRMTNWNEILEVIQEHCAAITPEASSSDYTSKDNAVNQFVSYHLLPFLAKYDYWACLRGEYGTNTYRYEKGIDDYPYHFDTPTHAVHYHQTMGQPNRLIQITYLPQKDKEGLYANRHALYDLSYGGDYQELSCPREGVLIMPTNGHRKQYAPNGIYYPLNHVLTYDKDVPEKVLNTRIRYNPVMNLPEIITNFISLPSDVLQGELYCHNIKSENPIVFSHLDGFYMDISEYRMMHVYQRKPTSYTLKLLPVPFEGEWEVRISELIGIFHFYMGNSKDGYMEDLGFKDFRSTGRWLPPYEPDNNGINKNLTFRPDSMTAMEIDKQCRQHGFLKAPYGIGGILVHSTHCFRSARCVDYSPWLQYRNIIYRGHMSPDKEYWIKVMFLSGYPQNFNYLNLIELVPKSVYSNKDRIEDWW